MSENIVIVGGGFAGVEVATNLEKALTKANDKKHRIIMVEKKSHFYHAIAGLRAAVVDIDNRIMVPYTNLFNNKTNQVIQASAVEFQKDHIVLDQSVAGFENQIVPYKYLIIATGTTYPVPAKASALDADSTHQDLKVLRQTVKGANSILIVGGGPVGIELAGEIREIYNDKKITLVHTEGNLLDKNMPEKFRNKLSSLLTRNNIETVYNEMVVLPDLQGKPYYTPEGAVETKSGKKIDGIDLVLLAFGNSPGTAWLKNSELGSSIVNPNGYVKVKNTLQVDYPELDNVFVLGDAADLNESKMAYRLRGHVPVLMENLTQLVLHQKKPTAQYKKGPDGMFITFGAKQGAGLLPVFGGILAGSWIVSKIKGGLFIDNSWKQLNAKPPTH